MLQLEIGETYLDSVGYEYTITGFDPFRKQYFSEVPTTFGPLFYYFSPAGKSDSHWGSDIIAKRPTKSAPMPSAAPACPVQHRIRTAAEVGLDEPTLVAYGGKIAQTLKAAPYANNRTVYAVVGGDVVALVPEWVETSTLHSFPDTGTQKSWCSCCDAEGRFDWRAGKYF